MIDDLPPPSYFAEPRRERYAGIALRWSVIVCFALALIARSFG